MESRAEKYYQEDYNGNPPLSRSSRNSKLYRSVYGKYQDLDNLPIEDNTDEIDMDKLKELVSNMNNKENKIQHNNYNLNILEQRKRNIDEQKVYDINKLLEKAKYDNSKLKEKEDIRIKKGRSILSTLEGNELSTSDIKKACQKYETFNNNLENQQNKSLTNDNNDLTMTRELKYHTKKISDNPLIEQVIPDNDMALDLLEDLKPTGNTIVTKPIKEENIEKNIPIQSNSNFFEPKEVKEDISDIDIIKKDKTVDTDFFTSSYQFSKKDFSDDEDDFFEEPKSHNFLKIILLILAIIVFAGVIFYFIKNYGIGA